MFKASAIFQALLLATLAFGQLKSTEEWVRGNRRIYQILTDRFETGNGQHGGCNLKKYCGGNWEGIRHRLPYIRDLGFNAIWISSHLKQIETGPYDQYDPYHGYHIKDFYALNEHFGSEADLRALINEAHSMGIWVMVDVVYNHMGPVDFNKWNPYEGFNPFNRPEHYHDCNGCPSDCNIKHWTDHSDFGEVEHCRLSGLPDLNQSNDYVSRELIRWAVHTVNTYDFDGFRIDTVPEVHPEWAAQWHAAIGNGYTLGEVFDGNIDVIKMFAKRGHYPGVFQYPLFFSIQDSIMRGQSMDGLRRRFEDTRNAFADVKGPSHTNFASHHALSPFSSNHDNGRLLSINGDRRRAINAMVFTLTVDGIPTLYYGEEQFFSGGYDPANREPMWQSGFSRSGEGFRFVQATNRARDLYPRSFLPESPTRFLLTSNELLAYSRGEVLVVITNVGQNVGQLNAYVNVSHMWGPGTKVCNVFWSERKNGSWSGDCVTVTDKGQLGVSLLRGEPKLYVKA